MDTRYIADELMAQDNVVSVGYGYKYVKGKRTMRAGIIVGVKKKKSMDSLRKSEIVPLDYGGVPTDVIQYGELVALGLTNRKRPCPPGYSVGHPNITAGTLGVWVHRNDSDDWHILSNNHVLAASNDAVIGDATLQPGPADRGQPIDRLADLSEYVVINFAGAGGKKKKSALAWKLWKGPANLVARLIGCPYRLVVTRPSQVSQPDPNLVDAALARVRKAEWVETPIPFIGKLTGIRDLRLGDEVQKVGRSTIYTQGPLSDGSRHVPAWTRGPEGLRRLLFTFGQRQGSAGGCEADQVHKLPGQELLCYPRL